MSRIHGVSIRELRRIPDERGYLMECLRADDPEFETFGQAYVSAVYENVVKGWHYHEAQTDLVVCIHGMIKLAVYDGRADSPTRGAVADFAIGDQRPALVRIPPGLHHGWMGLTPGLSLVLNCPDRAYDRERPDEHRVDPHDNDIPYDWTRADG